MVDPTTGLLPCTTWYFKGQSHEDLANNDVVLNLATELMTDNNMVDVYSNPVAYPQFNGARSMRNVNRDISLWNRTDKSDFTADEIANVEEAIAAVNALKNETVIDAERWLAAQDNLDKALVSAGAKEGEKTDIFGDIFTKIFKGLNLALNEVAVKIGL